MQTLVQRAREALDDPNLRQAEPHEIDDIIPCETGEMIDWFAQSYIFDRMVNLYRLVQPGHPDAFIAVSQGDGGVYLGWQGPTASRRAIEKLVGDAPEGWTDV